MPDAAVMHSASPITGLDVVGGLRRLGVAAGGVVMVHASLSRLGWVVGGSETVLRALLAAVGPSGTLCAQVSWEDIPFDVDTWPAPWRRAYEACPLPFDPAVAEAGHFEGRLAERLRTWPGARRSANPDAGVAAIGARAAWLVEPHGPDDGFGPATPYARVVEADGQVLLLGAPLESISLLHHAEAIADIPSKHRVRYRVPVQRSAGIEWQTCEDIDVRRGPVPYEDVVRPGEPPLAVIARAALTAGIGTRARIGAAICHLFFAAPLVRFATRWLEERFA